MEKLDANRDIEDKKDEQKQAAAEGKAAKKEEKQAAKEKRKSLKSTGAATSEPATELETAEAAATSAPPAIEEPATIAERRDVSSPPNPIRTSMENQASMRMRENADAANREETTPMSPSSPGDNSKVKNWLKTKFARRMSKPQKHSASEQEKEPEKTFVGGAALTGASANDSTASIAGKPSSVRDVAMAGKAPAPELGNRGRGKRRDSEVSASSEPIGDVDEDEFQVSNSVSMPLLHESTEAVGSSWHTHFILLPKSGTLV